MKNWILILALCCIAMPSTSYGGVSDWIFGKEETKEVGEPFVILDAESEPLTKEDVTTAKEKPVNVNVTVEDRRFISDPIFGFLSFLAVGTLWFWLLLGIEIGFICYHLDRSAGGANFAFLVFLTKMELLAHF